MTSMEEAGDMIERALLGPGHRPYNLARDTPGVMQAQMRRTWHGFGAGVRMARALGIPARTARRWLREGLPERPHDREKARERLSRYYSDRRPPATLTAERRAELLAGGATLSAQFTQHTTPERTRTLGTEGWGQIRGDVVAQLARAHDQGARGPELVDVFLRAIGQKWYTRAVIPATDTDGNRIAAPYDRYGVEPDDDDYVDDSYADDGDDSYASTNWAWANVSIAA